MWSKPQVIKNQLQWEQHFNKLRLFLTLISLASGVFAVVCLLKYRSLSALENDLIGKLLLDYSIYAVILTTLGLVILSLMHFIRGPLRKPKDWQHSSADTE